MEFLIALGLGLSAAYASVPLTRPTLALEFRVAPQRQLNSKPIRGEAIPLRRKLTRALRRSDTARIDRAIMELPDILDLLSVALSAGVGIYRTFELVVPQARGEIATELRKVLRGVEFGAAFGSEVKKLSEALPHPLIAEFANKIALATERGTPLAQMLSDQSQSVRSEVRNRLLRQVGKNETRMLIPLVFLILPVTVLFAIYPSLRLLSLGFI
jgi:tight adherence protein C